MTEANGNAAVPEATPTGLERVADRVRAFHADTRFDGASITFAAAENGGYWFEQDPDGGQMWIVATALIQAHTTAGKEWTVAQGTARHAYPRGGSEVERVQTAAIGRALAAAGYPGATSIESTEGIAAHASDPTRTLADQDAIKRVLAAAFPRTGDGYQAHRLAAIKQAGLPYESVGAALSGMTVAELDQLTQALDPAPLGGESA